tara:strand:- start:2398 stop:2850 length:453 start_codon:yes stop_codon:yes gene_type:complete
MSHTERTLQNLINICEDAREFYSDAIDQTSDPEMKRLCRQMADIRKGIIIDLRAYARQNDLKLDEASNTIGGQVNKFLGEHIAKWSDNTDEALIVYLEEAEDRCLHSFQEASNDDDLPLEARRLITEELTSLQKTHDYMKELKMALKNAA